MVASSTPLDLELQQLNGDPLVTPGKTYADVTEAVIKPIVSKPTWRWWVAFGISASIAGFAMICIAILFYFGAGVTGLNKPQGWGMMIVTFVFWIGIGHAGTLISAILFLFRQKWRTSINRAAEAMTIFAVLTALIFPLIHTGRPWLAALWLLPYPNSMGPLWVNFRSPLLWDVFAVSTYFTISFLFWFTGLVPDLATLRDKVTNPIQKTIYGLLSLGWKGSNRNWSHYEVAYLLFAGISTPLVLSVHTVVSFDFAVSVIPGWHTTIFPPYFVAGAIFSGFAMVITLMTVVRWVFNLQDYITLQHLENINKIILTTGMLVGLAYATEFFIAWYSGSKYEGFAFTNRSFGPFGWAYWIMVSCNVISPQVFWFKKLRRSIPVMFIVSIFVNIGMWFERFVITVTLHRDYLPSSWGYYRLSVWEMSMLFGSFGVFMTMFLLFCRFLPVIAISEVKGVMPEPVEPQHV